MGRLACAALCAVLLLQPSFSAALSDYLEFQAFNSGQCPAPLPDAILLSGGACALGQSIRCINSTAYEKLQWPNPDCSGVPAVVDSTVAAPPCSILNSEATKSDSTPPLGAFPGPWTDSCVSGSQLTFPVRRAGFVNFYSRGSGDDCAFPPIIGVSTSILIPLNECVHDFLLPGVAKTYSCSADGLTVTTFEQNTCSRSVTPIAVTYPTDECRADLPNLPGAWLISCPEAAPQPAASKAGLIGGLVVGGLIIAAAAGYFLWTRRATLFAGAIAMNGATSKQAPMGSAYAALDARASEM